MVAESMAPYFTLNDPWYGWAKMTSSWTLPRKLYSVRYKTHPPPSPPDVMVRRPREMWLRSSPLDRRGQRNSSYQLDDNDANDVSSRSFNDLPDLLLSIAERKKDSSLELLVHGLHLTKTDLKKMEKLTKINIHLHGTANYSFPTTRFSFQLCLCFHCFSGYVLVYVALFGAVEFGQVEKARAIMEDNEVDINRQVDPQTVLRN